MATVSFDVPDDMLPALSGTRRRLAARFGWRRPCTGAASRGEIATSRAAQLAGLTYAGFLEEAARWQVDLYHYDIEDVKAEVARSLPERLDTEAVRQDISRAQSRRS